LENGIERSGWKKGKSNLSEGKSIKKLKGIKSVDFIGFKWREKTMDRKYISLWIVGLVSLVWVGMAHAAAPVITSHFASSDLRAGDTWKIYLKASDSDGDMQYIVATVKQAGADVYPVSLTRIREENRKELSGYVYLNTMGGSSYSTLTFYGLTLTLWVKDQAGNFSDPVEVPLTFGSRVEAQALPPAGAYQDQDLGPVMIFLRSMSAQNEAGISGLLP
jgi:uncharacterized protein YdbL (DUF1318 family)